MMPALVGRNPGVPPIVGAALLALSLICPPALAQPPAGTISKSATHERVIVTGMTGQKKSRVHGLLSKLLRKAEGHSLAMSGAESWSVPKAKASRIAKRLKRLGHKVIRLGENWNHVLGRHKNPAGLTLAQKAVVAKLTASPQTVGVGLHRIQHAAVVEHALTHAETEVVLPLSEGRNVTLVRTRPTVRTDRGLTWWGEAVETGEPAVLMLWKDGHLSGYLGYNGRVFMINHMGGDIHAMAEMDPAGLPPIHPPEPPNKSADTTRYANMARPDPVVPAPTVAPFADAEREALEAKKITIDLMIAYTKNAASHYVGSPDDLLALAIEETNQTFRNSGLGNISLRLVHSQAIDYDEAGADHFQLLYGMVDAVGPFKDLKKLRDEKRADILGLIVDDPKGCGLSTRVGADAEEAFFIVHHSCATITFSIAHEIGHILGARHDRITDPNDHPIPYAHGYVNGTKWRTMMSYNEGCGGCPRIPYWSNPRIMFNGEPTGTPANDNARVILEQAERVSMFRRGRIDSAASASIAPKAALIKPSAKTRLRFGEGARPRRPR
jgi:hypothetical protein